MKHRRPSLFPMLALAPMCLLLACYTDLFQPEPAGDDDTMFGDDDDAAGDDDDGASDDDDGAPDDDDGAPDDDDGAPDDDDGAPDDDDATLPTGPPVPDPSALTGRVYSLDLGGATFIEPPGAGAIIQKNLADQYLLFALTDDSDFDEAAQPGLHVVGGAGEVTDAGAVQQDLCEETINMTAGADREFGTADDVPALWANPALSLGPTELVIDVDGTDSTLQDLLIQGVYTPSMDAFTDGTLSGLLDTRTLDATLGGEEGAVCSFVLEAYGVTCLECGAPLPGEFCLTVVAENVTGALLPGTVLEPRSCDQIIWNWISVGSCQGEAESYDDDGNGVLDGQYQGCPEFSG